MTPINIHSVRLVANHAMIGCVFAGVTLGWFDLTFDPHIGGAILGALAGFLLLKQDDKSAT
jgi:hypothetical protein